MSADSTKKSSKWIGTSIKPVPVNDKTTLETVMGYIQDMAYTNQPEDKEKIQWMTIEHFEIDEIDQDELKETAFGSSNLVLIIGYTNGVQMWIVQENGDAVEIFSLRQGPVKNLKLVLPPKQGYDINDKFYKKMPIIVFSDASSAGKPFCSAKFVSLKDANEVCSLSFPVQILDIQLNERFIIMSFNEKITVFNAVTLKEMFTVTSCYTSPGINANPMALGSRWLAYADKMLVPTHQSGGGVNVDNSQSYAATFMSAAQSVQKGFSVIRDTLTGSTPPSGHTAPSSTPTTGRKSANHDVSLKPGVVTIIDVQKVVGKQVAVQEDCSSDFLVVHFVAHLHDPVSSITFDPAGTLVLTADLQGRSFNLFKIMAHSFSSAYAAVHHLYTLRRGDTTAQIQSVSFTQDSRWVAVTTLRATTHIFPITTYGGQITKRTHMSPRVVGRTSRFHRSAGLEDIETTGSCGGGKDSPLFFNFNQPGSSPTSSPGRRSSLPIQQNLLYNNINNVCLPPYPSATVVHPIAQIRMNPSPLPVSTSAIKYNCGQTNSLASENLCVATCFARNRLFTTGKLPEYCFDDGSNYVEALYVMSHDGCLTEHSLILRPRHSPEKATDDTPIEAEAVSNLRWPLWRSLSNAEIRFPLARSCPIYRIFPEDKNGGDIPSPSDSSDSNDEEWLSQVEMSTYAGPYRRLWMGPQFTIKTISSPRSVPEVDPRSPSIMAASSSSLEDDVVDDNEYISSGRMRSKPMMMPVGRPSCSRGSLNSDAASASSTPQQTYIETMETGSYTCHSPAFLWANDSADEQVRTSLADAMDESNSILKIDDQSKFGLKIDDQSKLGLKIDDQSKFGLKIDGQSKGNTKKDLKSKSPRKEARFYNQN